MNSLFTERLTEHLNLEMIRVEGASFMMGEDEELSYTAHEVKLDTFYLAKYPVTQTQWKAVMGEENNPSYFAGDQRPVENVSWQDAQAFIEKLRGKTLRKYRLPTEAEWEFAARGGKQSKAFSYSGSNELEDVGWFYENSHEETKDVGLKFPNELGLCDMSGNVWEWCQDWYYDEYYQECKERGLVMNPAGPRDGSERVIRGGGWINNPRRCRSAYRLNWDPVPQSNGQGFRLAFSFQSAG